MDRTDTSSSRREMFRVYWVGFALIALSALINLTVVASAAFPVDSQTANALLAYEQVKPQATFALAAAGLALILWDVFGRVARREIEHRTAEFTPLGLAYRDGSVPLVTSQYLPRQGDQKRPD